MTNISYNQIVKNIKNLENITGKYIDPSLLYIVLFMVKEKIIPLHQSVTSVKKKFIFKNKYNNYIFDLAKNIFFYNSEKLIKLIKEPINRGSVIQINTNSEIPFEFMQFNDTATIAQNLQNLISYNEHIGNSNLVDIIVPMCKTEPLDLTKSDICDCDSFTYDELSRKEIYHKYDEIFPKLPTDRGIIKYLNALLGVICLIDSRDKVIDHNIFFEAIQKNLHSDNETEFNEKYSLYDSINIDFKIFLNELNEKYGRNENSNIVEEKERKMFDYVNKIKNIESKFNSEFSTLYLKNKNKNKSKKKSKKKKTGAIPMNHIRNVLNNSNTKEDCNKYNDHIELCNKKGNFFSKKKNRNNCLLASEYKKKCRKSNNISKKTRRKNLKKCMKKYFHHVNNNSNATVNLQNKQSLSIRNAYNLDFNAYNSDENHSISSLKPEIRPINTQTPITMFEQDNYGSIDKSQSLQNINLNRINSNNLSINSSPKLRYGTV